MYFGAALGSFCVEGIGPHDSGGGSDSENDWAVAETQTINLAKSGTGEAFTTPINWGTANYSLKFEVAARMYTNHSCQNFGNSRSV